MPGINDPGYELVREAIARGHRISPVPGPSAVLTALVASGISANSFYYVGFCRGNRKGDAGYCGNWSRNVTRFVAFETPHRLRDSLQDMENILGATRQICAAREVTKKFEEFQRGTIAEVRTHFLQNDPRGEFTLVITGVSADHGRRTDDPSLLSGQAPRRMTMDISNRSGQTRPTGEMRMWDRGRSEARIQEIDTSRGAEVRGGETYSAASRGGSENGCIKLG